MPEKAKKSSTKDPDDTGTTGTLMIKRDFLSSIQTTMSETSDIVKKSSDKTDELISKITEGLTMWEATQRKNAEEQQINLKKNEEQKKIEEQTKIEENKKKQELAKVHREEAEKKAEEDTNDNTSQTQIETMQAQINLVIKENSDMKTVIADMNTKITTLSKNVAALRAGQATTDIELKKTQDLTSVLPPRQTYCQVTKPQQQWQEAKQRRQVQPQPIDEHDEVLLQTEGHFKSSEAKCQRRRQYQPPQELSSSTILSAQSAVIEKQKLDEEQGKQRRFQPKDPEDDDVVRDHIIAETFLTNKLIIGFRPITLSMVDSLTRSMEAKGIFDGTHDQEYKLTKSMQTAAHMYMQNQLKMSITDRKNIKIKTMFFSTNISPSTLYVHCESYEDTATIYKHAINLPKSAEGGPQLDYYTPPQFHKRRSEIETLAWRIRVKSEGRIQTNIRQGRKDYILRQRPKGSTTPWSEIPPTIIPDTIAKFEISKHKVKQVDLEEETDESRAHIFNEMQEVIQREKTEEGNVNKKRKLITPTITPTLSPTVTPDKNNRFALLQDLPDNDETDDSEGDEDMDTQSEHTTTVDSESNTNTENTDKTNQCSINTSN